MPPAESEALSSGGAALFSSLRLLPLGPSRTQNINCRPAEIGFGDFGCSPPTRPLFRVKGEKQKNFPGSEEPGKLFCALDAKSLSCYLSRLCRDSSFLPASPRLSRFSLGNLCPLSIFFLTFTIFLGGDFWISGSPNFMIYGKVYSVIIGGISSLLTVYLDNQLSPQLHNTMRSI